MSIHQVALNDSFGREFESKVLDKLHRLNRMSWFVNCIEREKSCTFLTREGGGSAEISSVGLAEFQNLSFVEYCLVLRHVNIRRGGRGFGSRTMKAIMKGYQDTNVCLVGWVVPMEMSFDYRSYEVLDDRKKQERLCRWYQKLGWSFLDLEMLYTGVGLIELLERWQDYKEIFPTPIAFCGIQAPDFVKEEFEGYKIPLEEHLSRLQVEK